jgi:hypothetical protein
MRVIHVARPPPIVVESVPQPKSPPKRIIGDFLDDDFVKCPVDLRKASIGQLPQTPVQVDEEALTIPLRPLIASRIRNARTPATPAVDGIREVRELLEHITGRKKQPAEFHLSEHLLPPPKYKYCPEMAFTEHRIHEASRDREVKVTDPLDRSRRFPNHLITRATRRAIPDRYSRRARRTTFAEPFFG